MKIIQKLLRRKSRQEGTIKPGSEMWKFLELTDLRRYRIEQELYGKKKML